MSKHHYVSRLALSLAQNVHLVCRYYLSKGHRQGRYWRVGDVHNQPGQSLYVQLSGEKAGRWSDAATGQFGDLIDLIELIKVLHQNRRRSRRRACSWPWHQGDPPETRQ